MDLSDHPKIVAVAVMFNELIISKPKPARHGDILTSLYEVNTKAAHSCLQGFLTDEGEFITREVARKLIEKNGQTTIDKLHPYHLFSENLW